MTTTLTRRELLGGAAAAWAVGPSRPLVDTHIHLFAADQQRFPYHPNAPYKPPAQPWSRTRRSRHQESTTS